MEKRFLDKVEDNAACEYGPRKGNKRKYWNPAYGCFTFGKVDMVPTVEEYTTLLRCLMIQVIKHTLEPPTSHTRRKIDTFTLSIYGLVIFPKALGHIEDAVSDMFDRLEKMVTPVPIILDETFKSLNVNGDRKSKKKTLEPISRRGNSKMLD
ncbi:hypothetical protein Gohar_016853 [Gossypium harknessii]|uniref:Uncharacterized protein n=1 Tax=Gossypium harknessii TaxID=34285 RepID=A0A7J9G6B8_9ROSI|nr:hypothetical protein [Gossypium harknessii]